ncbi:unnamed protein product [Ostreobium quekettii]|uniref:MPN domain-containing protein n=1 Tax=Ostreobium quekettii TaxID=121088 RepID=A0A8S1J253_9CHLO|nr:unnamed protein product [Ostreobium quekettii]|eukprot:evm.model.scf_43EXC.8 EVM.evm.TU.scf_43EXC.8   scf_43EXC:76047-78339(-)
METSGGPAHPRPEHACQIGASNLPEFNWGVGGTTAAFPNASGHPDYGGMTVLPGQPGVGGTVPPPDIMINSTLATRSRTVNRHEIMGSSYGTNNNTLGGTAVVGTGVGSVPIGVQYPTIDVPSVPMVVPTGGPLHSAFAADGLMQQASLMDAAPTHSPSGFPASNAMGPGIGPQLGLQHGPQETQVQTVAAHASAEVVYPGRESASQSIVPTRRHGGLRDVHISLEMLNTFLEVAKMNTQKSISTCALLAGELIAEHSLLQVRKLIFPKQKGCANRVEMTNGEEEVVDEVLGDGLLMMGWIYSRTEDECDLSSIDVHTAFRFQIMLPEAVTIVMAPADKRRKCGIFRLTTPGGMDVVRTCALRGYHAHKAPSTGQEIYELCQHVYLNPRLRVSCRDLR